MRKAARRIADEIKNYPVSFQTHIAESISTALTQLVTALERRPMASMDIEALDREDDGRVSRGILRYSDGSSIEIDTKDLDKPPILTVRGEDQ